MRLIDGDALIEELNASHFPGAPYVDAGISIAIGKVCDAPTIEPESDIIHCGECRHFTTKGNIERVEFGKCSVIKSVCLREDYCSWAERKEGEADDHDRNTIRITKSI